MTCLSALQSLEKMDTLSGFLAREQPVNLVQKDGLRRQIQPQSDLDQSDTMRLTA